MHGGGSRRLCLALSQLLTVFLVSFSGVSPAWAAGQPAWTLSTRYQADSFQTVNLREFARDVEQATQGALRIDVRSEAAAGSDGDIVARIGKGQLAAGEVIMSELGSAAIPLADADSIPFLVGNLQEARQLWDLQRALMEASLQRAGLVPLYAVPWPSQGLYTTRSVHSVAELKATHMRTYNPATVRMAQILGAAPVDVAMRDVGEALAQGRIDSMFTSGVTGTQSRVWEQPLKYFYDVRAWFPKNVVLISKAQWDALDAGTRQRVLAAARRAEDRGWRSSEAIADASLAELTRHGLHVESPDFHFRRELVRLGERLALEYVRQTGPIANQLLIPFFAQRTKERGGSQ